MTRSFHGWGWDHWPELWSSAPSTAETAQEVQEAAQPTPQDWASVSGQPPIKIVVPYSFTPADELAEGVVLDELAVLGERGLSPWAAASRLFNATRDTAGVTPGGDGPRSGPGTPLTPPGADPLPV